MFNSNLRADLQVGRLCPFIAFWKEICVPISKKWKQNGVFKGSCLDGALAGNNVTCIYLRYIFEVELFNRGRAITDAVQSNVKKQEVENSTWRWSPHRSKPPGLNPFLIYLSK